MSKRQCQISVDPSRAFFFSTVHSFTRVAAQVEIEKWGYAKKCYEKYVMKERLP